MRKSRQEAAQTRQRIVEKAAEEFTRHGIAETGLNDVMHSAGLTHGGFYKHFESKEQLLAEALTQSFAQSLATIEEAAAAGGLPALLDAYLSPTHRDQVLPNCPLSALGTELRHALPPTRQVVAEGLSNLVAAVERQLDGVPPAEAPARARAIVAAMVGSMILARALPPSSLSDDFLADTRRFLLHP